MPTWMFMLFAVLAPTALLLGIVMGWRALFDRDRRRSPLTKKVLNLPGDSLRREMATYSDKMDQNGMVTVYTGPAMLATWAIGRLYRDGGWEGLAWRAGDWMFVAAALAMITWSAHGFIRHGKRFRQYKQGMEAEIAVAQNLLPLMAEGCMIFHDVPADGFNIDHVVVAPNAVFAVETKSRRKPSTGGRDAARIEYDGRALRFPGGVVETAPIHQAQRQAEWLATFLRSGTGQPVNVIPVLALPGWYVKPTGTQRPAVLAINSLNSNLHKLAVSGSPMTQILQRQVAHVLTERYPGLA